MERRGKALLISAMGSLVLHLAWGLVMPRARQPVVALPAEVEMTVMEPQPAAAAHVEEPATAPAANDPVRAPAQPARKPRRAREPLTQSNEQATITPNNASDSQTPSAADDSAVAIAEPTPAPASGSHPPPASFSPSAVAQAWAASEARACNPAARSDAADSCRDRPPSVEQLAQEKLDRSMRAAAVARPYAARREPPVLKRQSDGSYSYSGRVFVARVAPDGQASFDVKTAGLNTVPLGGHFDLNDALERTAGNELYVAEKRWFLEQTEALRDQLAAASRSAELARAKRALEVELERIFQIDQSAERKRAALFARWEDCGDDGEAAAVRRVVENFIRVHMPQGSELGYDAAELERLNRDRPSTVRFDPYRG